MLPSPTYQISHAPQSPYFCNISYNAGYLQVYLNNPDIDFIFVQYYNQGASAPYNTYDQIFVKSAEGGQPGTAVTQIAGQDPLYHFGIGVPLNKLVVGKPLQITDGAPADWVSPANLHAIVVQAKADKGWDAGVGVWQFHTDGTPLPNDFIAVVYPPT